MEDLSKPSSSSEDFTKIKENMLHEFECASVDELDFFALKDLIISVYEYGRLHNKYSFEWTNDENEQLLKYFPNAIRSIEENLREFSNGFHEENYYLSKLFVSGLIFLIDDVFEQYKKLNPEPEVLAEMEKKILQIFAEKSVKISQIRSWTDRTGKPKRYFYEDEKPLLDGVPMSHDWWTEDEGLKIEPKDDSDDEF
uniref:Uncharacterized protein n=1 Tax=Panagrolaimus sp. JU765 TaxID=591449 RepID=A0AC34PV89_9BILA